MTEQEAIAALDAIGPGDPEAAHGEADRIMGQCLPDAVAAARRRAEERVGGFWYA